jgi:hypothetical protein
MLADSAPDISTSAHPDNSISFTANQQSRDTSSLVPSAVSFSVTAAIMRARRPSSRTPPPRLHAETAGIIAVDLLHVNTVLQRKKDRTSRCVHRAFQRVLPQAG